MTGADCLVHVKGNEMPKFNLANFFGMDTEDQPENQIEKPADNVVLMNRQEPESSSIIVFEPINYTDVDEIAQKLWKIAPLSLSSISWMLIRLRGWLIF